MSLLFVIGLDFQPFIRCSIGTRFPFWEGQQVSLCFERRLCKHRAVPVPGSVSATLLSEAARVCSFTCHSGQGARGLVRLTGRCARALARYEIQPPHFTNSGPEVETCPAPTQAARSRGTWVQSRPHASLSHASPPCSPATCQVEFRCSTGDTRGRKWAVWL